MIREKKASIRFQLIDQILADPYNRLSVVELCDLADVSRSGYYRWKAALPARIARDQQDNADFQIIKQAYEFRGYDKGVRGIYMRLLHMGIRMNHKKIRRLMHKYDLKCPVRKPNPYRQILRELRTEVTADNLVNREFKEHGPRQILLTDITYIRLNDAFVYLSVIIDAFTMQALSYELSDSLEIEFVLETVRKLIIDHGASMDDKTYIHSDQGSHYTSTRFRELVKDVNLIQSMSRKGNCWDNAPQESFFGHMKDELGDRKKQWETIEDVRKDIDDWMDYYNNDRYQEGLMRLSPNEYYEMITTGAMPDGMIM